MNNGPDMHSEESIRSVTGYSDDSQINFKAYSSCYYFRPTGVELALLGPDVVDREEQRRLV